MADTEDNKTQTQTKKTESKTQAQSKSNMTTAGFSKDEASTIEVETTGSFQLYDPVSQTTYPSDKSVKRPENDQFVQTNLTRGKLKKVK